MKNISCCFTGHRDIPASAEKCIRKKLSDVIIQLIEEGYTEFYTGGALGFDTIAAETVLSLRMKHENIHLHVIMPCRNQTRGWSAEDALLHDEINKLADEVLCLSESYYSGCMHARNRYMADHSSKVIAYLTKTSGGSAATVNYALKKGIEVINIAL